MQALLFHATRDLRFETVRDPRLEAHTDAIVRVERTAICGSDLHVYHGRERGLDAGTVMGHEFVGQVVETGRGVERIATGDRVLSPFTTSCGRCFFCTAGLTSRCSSGQLFGWVRQGVGLHGAQAELVRVPLADSTLVPIPEHISADVGLLLGDVMSTGFYCAERADIRPDGVYVVIGCGPVGLMAVLGVRHHGAARVFAVDTVPERLQLARDFGATPLDRSGTDVVETVREATDGRGADAVLEVVGNESAHRSAMDLVRPGGTVSVVGVHNEDRFAFTPAEAYDKNLTYRVGRCPARHMIERLIPVLREKDYDPTPILSHRLPLKQGVRGYTIFDEKRDGCTKVVLTP